MAFQPCPNIAELSLYFLQDSQPVENVVHINRGAGWTVTDFNAVFTAVNAWWTANLKPLQATTVINNGLHIRDLTTAAGAERDDSTNKGVLGTQAGTAYPNSVTATVTLQSGLVGRSFRGRIYHIGLVESQVVANTLTAGTQSAIASAYGALLTALNGIAGTNMVILSRYNSGAKRANGIGTPIAGVRCNLEVMNQRRRLPGHNRHR